MVSPLAPPDPFLAQVLGSLSDPGVGGLAGGVDTRLWIRRTGRYVEELCLEHLVRRSVLRRETHRLLGLLPYHRRPATDPARPAAVRDRFTAAEAAGFPDRRSRTLAALVSAVGLSGTVARGGLRKLRALRGLVDEKWTADTVYRNGRRSYGGGGGSGDD